MITAQDIRGKTFEKAVFGGYDMTAVDGFLSEVANDLALLQKENSTLKGKMKVLVEKIEEYRGNEDALRTAVLSAQKLGDTIEREARDKADAIIAEARRQASEMVAGADAAADAEAVRLEETKRSSARFIDSMEMLCRKQLEFLERVGELDFVRQLRETRPAPPMEEAPAPAPVEAPAAEAAPAEAPAAPAEIHETVKSIEETVAREMDAPVINVRPGIAPAVVEDERPTRPFNIITDAEEDVSKAVLFPGDGQ